MLLLKLARKTSQKVTVNIGQATKSDICKEGNRLYVVNRSGDKTALLIGRCIQFLVC